MVISFTLKAWQLYSNCISLCVFFVHSMDAIMVLNGGCSISFANLPCAGNVWFSLNGTTYQNNSCVTLEDIGEGDDALLCRTNLTACCRPPYTENGSASGNWFFPNGTTIPSLDSHWEFYRKRGNMTVLLNRRRGGVEGIYCCVIPDAMNITQSIYIGVYSACTGECKMYTQLFCLKYHHP